MNVPSLQKRYGKMPPGRTSACHPAISPYGAFTSLDGKRALLSVQKEREDETEFPALAGHCNDIGCGAASHYPVALFKITWAIGLAPDRMRFSNPTSGRKIPILDVHLFKKIRHDNIGREASVIPSGTRQTLAI